jgi:hypothetical protein
MNFDTKAFKAFKAELKTKLTAEKPSEKVQRLITLHANRMNDAVDRGIQSSRAYYAIDKAYDVSQHQITPTLMKGLIDRNPGVEEAQNLVKSWGLDSMLTQVPDVGQYAQGQLKNADGKPGYLLQAPTFFTIYLPILQSYVKARWAKLFGDRDLTPLYKYEQLVVGSDERLLAKLVTGRVQRMSSDMGYRMVERDSIQKMLLYGQAINFPRESWYSETQLINGKKKVVKEGVRFHIPHPTNVGYDMSHPLYTLNTDTGCEWACYWSMQRYGDLAGDQKLWLDRDKKGQLKEWMLPSSGWRTSDGFVNLYQQFYPCTVKFPAPCSHKSDNQREEKAFRYASDTLDAGVDIGVFFHKLNPKEWGLYDYDHMVWHRFVYAGNQKVLFCEPIFYPPCTAYLYDYDAERARNSSLGFELLPSQDHMGNLLTQYLLTVKKNLLRIVAFNSNVVGDDFIKKAGNFTENALRGIEFLPYDHQHLRDMGAGDDFGKIFQPVVLQAQQTTEIIQAMNTLIAMLERTLGYSAQEVGAAASHQQSVAEVNVIAGSTSTRINLTGGFIDDAIYARKKLLYYAMMNYSSDDIFVEIEDSSPKSKEALEKLGFKVTTSDDEPGVMTVTGSKKSLVFESNFSERDGANRSNDQQTAVMLTQFLQQLMQNPRIGAELPLPIIFKFFNQIASYLGLPPELSLPENVDVTTEQEKQKQLQQMQQMVGQIVQQLVAPQMQQLEQAVTVTSQKVGENEQQTEQALTAVAGQGQQTSQQVDQLAQQQAAIIQAQQQLMGTMDKLTQLATMQITGNQPAPVA